MDNSNFISGGKVVASWTQGRLLLYCQEVLVEDAVEFSNFILKGPKPLGYRITNIFEENPEYVGKWGKWELLNPHVDTEEVW